MAELSFLDPVYDLHLLVEDPRTSIYFKGLFSDLTSRIEIIPVGGCDGVSGLVNASWERESQSLHAYGWRDRDYGLDNTSKWNASDTHIFRGKAHEIENYFLDWDALRSCDKGNSDYDYKTEAKRLADNMLYRVACCRALYHLQKRAHLHFPSYPESSISMSSVADAVNYIGNSQWCSSHHKIAKSDCSQSSITRLVDKALVICTKELENGDWVQTFPGKDIFKSLWKSPCVCGHAKIGVYAESIARYQANHRKPDELEKFYTVLKNLLPVNNTTRRASD